MVTIVTAEQQISVSGDSDKPQQQLWLDTQELQQTTGWQLKAEGLCKGDVCLPLQSELADSLTDDNKINVSGLWDALNRPVLHDESYNTWMLGEAAEERTRQLESLEAPDFTLPDLYGQVHSLSDYRGTKIYLTTWASW